MNLKMLSWFVRKPSSKVKHWTSSFFKPICVSRREINWIIFESSWWLARLGRLRFPGIGSLGVCPGGCPPLGRLRFPGLGSWSVGPGGWPPLIPLVFSALVDQMLVLVAGFPGFLEVPRPRWFLGMLVLVAGPPWALEFLKPGFLGC